MNLHIKAREQYTYDAIVVGSGISGGWAAMELTKKGLKVLLLERGPQVEHIGGYPTATKHPGSSNIMVYCRSRNGSGTGLPGATTL
jgi:choline dehydrogenase-like flavoprotein